MSVEGAFRHSNNKLYTSKIIKVYIKVMFVWCYMLQHATTRYGTKNALVAGPPILFAQSLAHGLAVLGLHGPEGRLLIEHGIVIPIC